jgi:mannose-6-phosphate isomerase-like protein (cupin superfamily)
MTKVHLTTPEQCPWIISGQRKLTEQDRADLRDGELTSEFRVREGGSKATPQLVELRYQPDAEIQVHSHDADEIIYILEGSMRINNRVVGPGGCLYIAGRTFYGFHAGPDGLHILNFRPRADATFNLPPGAKTGAGVTT